MIDQDVWQEAVDQQRTGREQLSKVSRRWGKVIEYLESDND